MTARRILVALLLVLGACGTDGDTVPAAGTTSADEPGETTASDRDGSTTSAAGEPATTPAVPTSAPSSSSSLPGTSRAAPTTGPATSPPPSTSTPVSPTSPPATAAPAGVDRCPALPARAAPATTRAQYDVTMTADPTNGRVEGEQTIRFTPDLPVDTVVLRLWANGPRPSSVGSGITLGSVTEGGADRPVDRPDPTTAVVRLGRWVAPGTTLTLRTTWQLQVNGPVNDRISRQSESLRLGSFLPLLAWEPGRGWAVEPPTSGFAESTTSPVADWDLAVSVPDGFSAVVSGVESGPGRWRAELARDVSVAVGRFSTTVATANAPHPVQVVVAVHDGVDDPSRYLGQLVAQLEQMAVWFGPYPWPTYQLSITPNLSGGIEFPMHVLQGPSTDGRTTPHEVAHMWFYGLVGNNQGRDPWLDEGIASYVEARILGTLSAMRDRSIPSDGRGRADAPMTYWESRPRSYYRSVYVQPAGALARIADASGDVGLVDCALAHYVARNAHGIATPDDFAESFDATFGATDWRQVVAYSGLP